MTETVWQPRPKRERVPGRYEAGVTPAMIGQIRSIGTPRFAADGTAIYYPQDYNGRADIWRQPLAGGLPIQITADKSNGSLLKIAMGGYDISPDGTRIVYSAADGKLYTIPAIGGKAERLVQGEGLQFSPVFSPDGKQVAFTMHWGEEQAIFVTDATPGGFPRRISAETEAWTSDPQWSPDGRRIAFNEYDAEIFPQFQSHIVMADVATGERQTVVGGWEVNESATTPRFSPDGKTLAYVSDRSGYANVWLHTLGTPDHRQLANAHFEQSEPAWSPDGTRILYSQVEHAASDLYVTALDGETQPIARGQFVATDPTWSPDGSRVAWLQSDPITPLNVFTSDGRGGQPKALTNNTIGGLDAAGLVTPEVVTWRSDDGLEIEGLIFTPKDVRPGQHPLLLYIHGGPFAQYMLSWNSAAQYYVQQGWVVVEPNFRGSTGYGRAFREKLLGTWGHEDMLDNIGGIHFAQSRGLIDPTRVVAWGGSGGGYATMLLLGKWPELFKAGVALVGVSNFASFPDVTDRIAKYLIQITLGARRDNHVLYVERSPVTYADKVRAPLLILMGEKDARVPPSQGEEMVEALKRAGKVEGTDFEYLAYPNEGHGWRKSESVEDYYKRMDAFLFKNVLDR